MKRRRSERELEADDLTCEVQAALKALKQLACQAEGAGAEGLSRRVVFWCVDLKRVLRRLDQRQRG